MTEDQLFHLARVCRKKWAGCDEWNELDDQTKDGWVDGVEAVLNEVMKYAEEPAEDSPELLPPNSLKIGPGTRLEVLENGQLLIDFPNGERE